MKSAVWIVVIILFLSFILSNCSKEINSSTPGSTVQINFPSNPLQSAADLDLIINQIGDARIVLLGEASHGTAEYYTWRAALSKRLIQEKSFDMIAVEGEWADSYRVNQFVKGSPKDSLQAVSLLRQYDRWPTWMWGNYEVASLITWMNNYNQSVPVNNKVGFFGLDVYCLWESMQELMPYIQRNDSLTRIAQKVRQCFQPYSADPMQYASAVANSSADCREETERLWLSVMSYTGQRTAPDEPGFAMQQNALVALNGERYYSASVSSYPGSWNVRDNHMTQTIRRLLEHHGDDSKIIVWEHNTHVGDARYTDMEAGGMVNVGQLVREQFGQNNVYIVGFGSYQGTVIAADEWGADMKVMNVPAAQTGSWEDILHRQSANDKIVLSTELKQTEGFERTLGNRAIGVVYNPNQERGNYVPSNIANRYDAFVFINKTTALRPLGTRPKNEPPDTYPLGY